MPAVNLQTWSGNRIACSIGGLVIGLCQSARLSDSYALEDASGIGDIHVIEHVPTKAVHTVAVTNMCMFNQILRGAGYTINGIGALAGLVFDIILNGTGSNGTPGGMQRQYISCSYDSGDVDITAHRITIASGQFKALDVLGTGF
jgi:hypothetical protein